MANDKDERQKKLGRAWELMADAILRALEVEAPSAATLSAARQFLKDNDVTLSVLRDWRRGVGIDYATLPTFNDADDYEDNGSSREANPLKTIAPFAATNST